MKSKKWLIYPQLVPLYFYALAPAIPIIICPTQALLLNDSVLPKVLSKWIWVYFENVGSCPPTLRFDQEQPTQKLVL